MKTTYQNVKEFHQVFGHPAPSTPEILDAKTLALRLKLINEEFTELVDSSLVQTNLKDRIMLRLVEVQSLLGHILEGDVDDSMVAMIGQFDALCDLDYVVNGHGVAAGYPMDKGAAEVHASNMSKLGADGKPIYRKDGKVMKGENYFKPNLRRILVNSMPIPVEFK